LPAGALVSIRNLTVAFEGVPALRGVDLEVGRGEAVGLVGESGCGKSVTWLAALGLLPVTATIAGSITLDGEEILGAPPATLDRVRGGRIAMIFQDPASSLNPVHRVGHQVAEAVRLHRGLAGAAARRCAAAVRPCRHPGPRAPDRQLSARTLRRAEPARYDRHGAGRPAGTAGRR
jgi:peptide/nickel transport system ATP-binding protein